MSTKALPESPVVDYVRKLQPEEKDSVLIELVREAIQETGGNSLLPVQTTEGESLGYFVPSNIAEQHFHALLPKMDAGYQDRTRKALSDLSQTIEMESFLERVTRQARESAG